MLSGQLPEAPMYVGGMAETIMEVYVAYAEKRSSDDDVAWVRSGQFPRAQSLLHKRLGTGSTFEEVAAELLSDYEPGFILASPAMLGGGWSLTFANQMVDDPRHAIIFTGYLPRDDRDAEGSERLAEGPIYTLDGAKRRSSASGRRWGSLHMRPMRICASSRTGWSRNRTGTSRLLWSTARRRLSRRWPLT